MEHPPEPLHGAFEVELVQVHDQINRSATAVLLVAIRRAKAGYLKSALYLEAPKPVTARGRIVNPDDAT